jgi:hypothetical protein
VLVLTAKAEMVEPADAHFRDEHGEFVIPAVLRLITFVRLPYRTTVSSSPASRPRPRRRSVCLPCQASRHRGSRRASSARRRPPLGERRGGVPATQRQERRLHARRVGSVPPGPAARTQGDPLRRLCYKQQEAWKPYLVTALLDPRSS